MLVVEDNATLAYFTARNLRQGIPDAEVVIAGTYRDALDQIVLLAPSVVVVDVGLGDRNGLELVRELSQRRIGAAVIITSGDRPRHLDTVGTVGFLTKPYEASALIDMVRKAMSERPVERSAAPKRPRDLSSEATVGGIDRHFVRNRLAGLLAGLRTLQSDLTTQANDAAAIQRIAADQIDALCESVKELSASLPGGRDAVQSRDDHEAGNRRT